MQQAKEYIRTSLQGIYPQNEINSISNLIIAKITGFSRTEIILNKNTKISANQRFLLEKIVEALKNNTPVQYVLGETEFYGLPFKVDSNVLIPRPETEELVEWIQSSYSANMSYRMLDIGTGSGCIAIALKSIFPKSMVSAFDISVGALEIARDNAELNGCEIDFRKVDILQPKIIAEKWDIIVSNPPYIPEMEKSEILAHVLEFEPHTALFVPDSRPLLFYETIATFALQHLNIGGMLFFEIHRDFGLQTVQLLEKLGFKDVILRKDVSGNDRMVRATV
jgi:release factor glutamine methyltransferase